MSELVAVGILMALGVALAAYGLVKLQQEDKGRGCPPHKWENFLDGLRCLKCHRKPGEVPRQFKGDHINGGLL